MRILFINHNFNQDMMEIIHYKKRDYEFHWISAQYFAKEASKYFPDKVFGDFDVYHRPEYRNKRKRFSTRLEKVLYRLYHVYQFDIIIAPSDTFFYVRPLITACRNLGIPFFVAQKETTISPGGMEVSSVETGKYFPFISDHMTVCSENHKEFWVRSGCPKDKITVTGQPRFDYYFRIKKEEIVNLPYLPVKDNKVEVLFFTYELNAYIEPTKDLGDWSDLRAQTEEVLAELAKTNKYRIIIKPHPQHNLGDIKNFTSRIRSLAGNESGKSIYILDRTVDARQLILRADVIIAFQTTALIEALAMKKKVIYTYWGNAIEKAKDYILPFDAYSDALICVRSPQELLQAVNNKFELDEVTLKKRKEIFEGYLGPFDGNATKRTWYEINKISSYFKDPNDDQWQLRKKIKAGQKRYCYKEIILSYISIPVWQVLTVVFKSLKARYYSVIAREQTDLLNKRIQECTLSLHNKTLPEEITGHLNNKILLFIRNKVIHLW